MNTPTLPPLIFDMKRRTFEIKKEDERNMLVIDNIWLDDEDRIEIFLSRIQRIVPDLEIEIERIPNSDVAEIIAKRHEERAKLSRLREDGCKSFPMQLTPI
jgi:hypothetical protein